CAAERRNHPQATPGIRVVGEKPSIWGPCRLEVLPAVPCNLHVLASRSELAHEDLETTSAIRRIRHARAVRRKTRINRQPARSRNLDIVCDLERLRGKQRLPKDERGEGCKSQCRHGANRDRNPMPASLPNQCRARLRSTGGRGRSSAAFID